MQISKTLRNLIIVLTICIAPASRAFGWIDTGHKIIAMIVWDQLTPASRTKLVEILKQHPRYNEDLLLDFPDGAGDEDTEKYALAMASTWPDAVRSQSNPMHTLYAHSTWHYVDFPYSPDNTAPPTTRPFDPGIVDALQHNVDALKKPDIAPPDKAIAACWVLHLCGDIHQPLHCIELFSKQFPNGDQGGNAQIVLRDPPYPNTAMNLHLIWDELPGNYKSIDAITYIAKGLQNDPRYTRDKLKDELAQKDFAAWANQSHDLAVKYAYLDGKLQSATKDTARDPSTKIPGLLPGYIKTAEELAMKQIILAGYRTADLLNATLDH